LDAEKRLHEAATNDKCEEIKALAAGGTYMSCPDTQNVRSRLRHCDCMYIEVGRTWPSYQHADLLWKMTTMQL